MAGFLRTDYFTREEAMMQASASDEEIADQVLMLFLPRDSVQRFAAPKAYQAPQCSRQASASSSTTKNKARCSSMGSVHRCLQFSQLNGRSLFSFLIVMLLRLPLVLLSSGFPWCL